MNSQAPRFGNTLRETGAFAGKNPFRFSTKYTDVETGLIYYGRRSYSPTLGRFINRDPSEEAGGLNLYGFCLNNGVNHWDILGLEGSSNEYDWQMAMDIADERARAVVRYYRSTYGQFRYPGIQYDANLSNVWVTAYTHETDGFNAVADSMGIGSIFDSRTGNFVTMDQGTSSLYSNGANYFYGSDVHSDSAGNLSIVDKGGVEHPLEATDGGYNMGPAAVAPNSTAKTFDDRFKSATGGLMLQDSIDLYQKQTGKTLTADQVQKMFTDSAYAKSVLMADKSLHQVYRDILNTNIPGTQADAIKAGFEKLPWYQSIFHNPWYNPWQNSKYIAPDGHREAAYDRNGNPVTGNDYKGTFNFFGPSQAGDHKAADVDPYFKWGN